MPAHGKTVTVADKMARVTCRQFLFSNTIAHLKCPLWASTEIGLKQGLSVLNTCHTSWKYKEGSTFEHMQRQCFSECPFLNVCELSEVKSFLTYGNSMNEYSKIAYH